MGDSHLAGTTVRKRFHKAGLQDDSRSREEPCQTRPAPLYLKARKSSGQFAHNLVSFWHVYSVATMMNVRAARGTLLALRTRIVGQNHGAIACDRWFRE